MAYWRKIRKNSRIVYMKSNDDKYDAVWVSHSSIGDFLKCPRTYYLHNIYRSKDNRKINLVSPALSIGTAVHDTLEGLGKYKAEERFQKPLLETFDESWAKVSGKIGGFKTAEDESKAKERAIEMVKRVEKNPGPLLNKTLKLKLEGSKTLPNFYLSKTDNIILCGLIDWLEYVEVDDSVRVLDFKTGKYKEKKDSLQLPIYALLLNALQRRKVTGAAYWYLEMDDAPIDVKLPDLNDSHKKVLAIARNVKRARDANRLNCPYGPRGCYSCQPYEKILRGEAEFVGVGGFNQELYLI